MLNIDALAEFFMSEVRNQGEKLFTQDNISLSSATDTQVSAYVNAKGSYRVDLTSSDISDNTFQADCNCTKAKKGKLCNHIWATLLKLQATESDFLAYKQIIEKAAPKPESTATIAAKSRQAEYKQKIKQQQKQRNKQIRLQKKRTTSTEATNYPEDVEQALNYFSENGFDLTQPIQIQALNEARKTLSRVFHPDRGGTQAEMIVLNKNYDSIAAYFL